VSTTSERTLQVLLIEDDPGDAMLVREMLEEAGADVELTWVQTMAEAKPQLTPETRCVLLDLQLPDARSSPGWTRCWWPRPEPR